MKGREAYDVLGPGMVWASGWVKVSHRSVFVHIEGEGGLTMCGLHVWDSCDGLPADDAQVCDRCVRAVEPPEPVLDTTSEPVVQTWT